MLEFTHEQLISLPNSAGGIIPALITGVFTVIGVILGSFASQSAERKRMKSERIIEAYSEFMSIANLVLATDQNQITGEAAEQLLFVSTKIDLLLPKSVSDCADKIVVQLLNGIEDYDRFCNLLDRFIGLVRKNL